MCILTAISFAALPIRSIFPTYLPTYGPFSVGTELMALCICVIVYYSLLQGADEGEAHTSLFSTLLTTAAFSVFLDQMAFIMIGIPGVNEIARMDNALLFANGYMLVFMFWLYIVDALEMKGRFIEAIKRIFVYMLIPAMTMALLNAFVPLYFTIDVTGHYTRGPLWILSTFHTLLIMVGFFLGLSKSEAALKEKIIAASFLMTPLFGLAVSAYSYSISTQYSATVLSLLLIYGVLVAERSRALAQTREDLDMAAKIQTEALPSTFPAFPDRDEFDIYASMDPAREVGGDFYDFFLIDEDHLCIIIADVSGKGIPAALFMMASKSILAANAVAGRSPSEIISKTNHQLCANAKNDMFVTVWLGILEISTGKLTATNAGHEKPAIKAPGGKFELIRESHDFVVGGMDGIPYRQSEYQLQPGSTLFVFTDGLAEAQDSDETLLGEARISEALNKEPEVSPRQILANVTDSVTQFVGSAEQFDDLTMLCLHYKGPQTVTPHAASASIT
ncbi:MAG: PP2C family protein-serine/threonine phosphatase [Firmicutes bacterium]|nr:PP2C family protein-serine/threonine phosphatase [Bacillota bacterium]